MLTMVAEVGRNFILVKCHQKRSIRIWKWKSVTNLENKKHGPVVYLSLPEKNKMNDERDNGLKVSLSKVKLLYAKDSNALAFKGSYRFENFRQPEDISIVDYINGFERLNNQIKQFDMNLPPGVLAYKF